VTQLSTALINTDPAPDTPVALKSLKGQSSTVKTTRRGERGWKGGMKGENKTWREEG
jgi:hypothetical protein